MHERKVEMARRAGGFVALPGGYGTFEEVRQHLLAPCGYRILTAHSSWRWQPGHN